MAYKDISEKATQTNSYTLNFTYFCPAFLSNAIIIND